MGDIADAIKDLQESKDSAVVALDVFEGVISSVANISGGITGVVSVVSLIQSLFQGNDQMGQLQRSVDEILRKLNKLLELVKASDDLGRQRDLAVQLAAARAQLLPIQESSPHTPNFEAVRGDLLDKTATVLKTLEQIVFWQRPFVQEGVYHGWAGDLAPPNQDGIVFDYVAMLPAFIETITIRLVVLAVLFDDFPKPVASELAHWAGALEGFHNTIRDAIVTEMPPFDNRQDDRPLSFGSWERSGRRFGAVETYSAAAAVGRYPDDHPPPFKTLTMWEHDEAVFKFEARHALASRSRRNRVYLSVGLGTARKIIVQLRQLAGVPVGRTDDATSSLRDGIRTAQDKFFPIIPQLLSPKALAGKLDIPTQPLSLRTLLEIDT